MPPGVGDEEYEFQFDLTGYQKADELFRNIIPAGKYHAVIVKVEKKAAKDEKQYLEFRFLILAGTDKRVIGKNKTDQLPLGGEDWMRKKREQWAYRLGLLSDSDIGKQVKKSWRSLEGTHCVIEVEEGEYEKRNGSKGVSNNISFSGVWLLTHPDVKEVPKDLQSLMAAGIQLPTSALPTPGGVPPPANGSAHSGVPGVVQPPPGGGGMFPDI